LVSRVICIFSEVTIDLFSHYNVEWYHVCINSVTLVPIQV